MSPRALLSALAGLVCLLATAHAANIVILKNKNVPRFNDPARALTAAWGQKHVVRTIDLGGLDLNASKAKAQAIRASAPTLIIALGDRAAYVANTFLAPTPFVFGMVDNWEALTLDRRRATGVSTRVEPDMMASQIQMFLPGRRRVGIVYGAKSRAYVEQAMQRAAALKMTVMPIFVNTADEAPDAIDAVLRTVDIFWLVRDPDIVTRDNIERLIEASADRNVPVVTYSPKLVMGGLTMSVDVDRAAIGQQLLAVANQVLGGTTAAKVPVAAPNRAFVTLNRQSIERLGIQTDPSLLQFVQMVDTRGKSRRKGR
jgi:ABC-type uncharacterized transport system substrate-binding protein